MRKPFLEVDGNGGRIATFDFFVVVYLVLTFEHLLTCSIVLLANIWKCFVGTLKTHFLRVMRKWMTWLSTFVTWGRFLGNYVVIIIYFCQQKRFEPIFIYEIQKIYYGDPAKIFQVQKCQTTKTENVWRLGMWINNDFRA